MGQQKGEMGLGLSTFITSKRLSHQWAKKRANKSLKIGLGLKPYIKQEIGPTMGQEKGAKWL
jgi:hypothetical protein